MLAHASGSQCSFTMVSNGMSSRSFRWKTSCKWSRILMHSPCLVAQKAMDSQRVGLFLACNSH